MEINKELIKKSLMNATKKENLKESCQELEKSTKIKSHIWYSFSNGVISRKHFLFMLAYLEYHGNLDIRAVLRIDEIQDANTDTREGFLFLDNYPPLPPIYIE